MSNSLFLVAESNRSASHAAVLVPEIVADDLRDMGYRCRLSHPSVEIAILKCEKTTGSTKRPLNFHAVIATGVFTTDAANQALHNELLNLLDDQNAVILAHQHNPADRWLKQLYSKGLVAAIDLKRTKELAAEVDIQAQRCVHLDHLLHNNLHDPLTGLLNRPGLERALRDALQQQKLQTSTTLAVLDLDGFKHVNDRFGHSSGDIMLAETGRRLKAAVGTNGSVARIGGDEFAVLLTNTTSDNTAALMEHILDAVSQRFLLRGMEVTVPCSAGLGTATPGESLNAIFEKADEALYLAKQQGKGVWRKYQQPTAKTDASKLSRFDLARELNRAIETDSGLHLAFQPQVDIISREVVGIEALLRWDHPVYGSIAPGVFIPAAEQRGLMPPLGEWMVRAYCKTVAEWQAQSVSLQGLRLCLNLSPLELHCRGYTNWLMDQLERASLPELAPQWEAEITETAIIGTGDPLIRQMETLREGGINLALDDFGTGHSSLSHCTALPIDTLKIDRSFVGRLPDGRKSAALVRSLLALGNALDVRVVAEGVETALQWAFLRTYSNCIGQGFLFSRPIAADEVSELLRQQQSAVNLQLHEELKSKNSCHS